MDAGSSGFGVSGSGREATGRWIFPGAEFDTLRGELRVAGEAVELDRSAQEVLRFLLANAGNIATKAELMEAGWPGRVVAENSLTKAISRLRRALADEDGTLVRAVHGYGYRFAANVRFVDGSGESGAHALPGAAEGAESLPGSPVPHFPDWRVLEVLQRGPDGISLIAEIPGSDAPTRVFRQTRSEAGLRCMKRLIATFEHLGASRPGLMGLQPLLDWRLTEPPFTVATAWMREGDLYAWSLRDGNNADNARARRLQLFTGLARTVVELHATGVIHGDIRPANLYPVFAADQEPALLLCVPDGQGESGSAHRGSGPTPHLHVAPEVIAGEAPTARSDVYALGVLLFQSVVGDYTRPLAPGWEDQVQDPLLREDIALAAHVDPARRLASVQDLAVRVSLLDARHREARERTALEEQAALGRRMRWRARVAMTATLVLATLLGISLHQESRLAAARDEALASARTAAHFEGIATEVTAFLVNDVLGRADPYSRSGKLPDLREAIDQAALGLQGRFTAKPEAAAAIHHVLGKSYQGLNDYGRAHDHFEQAITLSARLGDAAGRALWLRALASRCELAVYSMPTPAAAQTCRDTIAEHHAGDSAPARAETFLALAELRMGRVREAQKRLSRVATFPGLESDPETLGYLTWFQASAAQRLGDLAAAVQAFGALAELRRKHAGDPSMLLAWALSEQGRALLDVGEIEDGVDRLKESKAMFDSVGGADHPHGVAPAVHLLAHTALRGEWERVLEDATRLRAQRIAGPGWDQWTLRLALLEARASAQTGAHAAARELLAEIQAFRVRSKLDENYPWLLDEILLTRAWSYLRLGDIPAAREALEERSRLVLIGPDTPDHAYIAQSCLEAEFARREPDDTRERSLESACAARLRDRIPEASLLLLNMRM